MAQLAQRLSTAETATEVLDIMKDVEVVARESPNTVLSCSKYLIPLFASPVASIRRSALNSALSIIAKYPEATDHFLYPYMQAMSNEDSTIAAHAISYLPHFVELSRVNAEQLIQCAQRANQRKVSLTGADRHIAEAMGVVKGVGIPTQMNL